MFQRGFETILIVGILLRVEVTAANIPDQLIMDDASREILFLDIYKRLSALEARTQMSDAVDWTQQTQFNTLKSLAENQQTWLKELQELVTRNGACRKANTNKKAAFSAYLDHDIDGTGSKKDMVIIFNNVILNEGDFYDTATGIFTCPWDGVYDLSFFIGQRGDQNVRIAWSRLLVNNKQIIMAVADAYRTHQDIQGGNRVIIRLTAGDLVKVVAEDDGNIFHIEGNAHQSTTFSGVFLFE